jgi:penicillin-binding protein 1A
VRTAHGGKIIYTRSKGAPERVIDGRYVAMMTAMMRETVLSGTGRRADLPGWPVAGKTGTSQDFRDAWFVGFTSQLVAGVWLGNDDNTPTKKITGGGLPVEVWSQFMRAAHRGKPPSDLLGDATAAIPPQNTSIPLPPAGIPAGRGSPMRPTDGAPPFYPPPPAGEGRMGVIDRLFLRR